jgi:AmmeMemoRadiSam system protein B
MSIRPAAVAGSLYPADPIDLRRDVEDLLVRVAVSPAPAIAAIVPHAGYEYSGSCAAEVFARVNVPRTVVLLGPNHSGAASRPEGASVWRAGAFATPLGAVRIDEEFAGALLEACPLVAHDPVAHMEDHALEVQLPFLLVTAAPRQPRIVPITLRWDDWQCCKELAAAIVAVASGHGPGNVLLLASSDMTHFEPAPVAMRYDEPALAAIQRLDGEGLLRVCRERDITMCGVAAAAVVLEASRQLGAYEVDVVAHTHSGFTTGVYSRVVSYAGVVIR